MNGTVSQVRKPSVAVVASGLGHVWRGYEAISLETGAALQDTVDVRLYGARTFRHGQLKITGLPAIERGWLATRLRFTPMTAYRIEQFTFSLALALELRIRPVDIVHVCDRGVARMVTRLRDAFGLPFRLVFCNSGNYGPEYTGLFDHVQLTTPFQHQAMIQAGLSPERLSIIPHGLHESHFSDVALSRQAARRSLGLPDERRLILTVTPWGFTKRLDYLLREVAVLRDSNLFVVVAGQPTPDEHEVRRLADDLLPNRYAFISIRRSFMPTLYRAVDCVALCRLHEGLPMAYLEAMAAKRPLLVHDWQLSRWMVPTEMARLDMTADGLLAERLRMLLDSPDLVREMTDENAAHVRELFDWQQLIPRYAEMYIRAVSLPSGSAQGAPRKRELGR